MKTCLIIDDSSIIRKMMSFLLQQHGFEVIEAVDGKQAQAILKHKLPDLIITDWSMPHMSGLELVRWVRTELKTGELGENSKPYIIFCTAQNNMEDIQAAILAGANEYIIKPFTTEIIKHKLELLGLI